MELKEPKTPLLECLRACTVPEQHQIAAWAKTPRNYLYQLATCQRRGTNTLRALRISEAITKMHVQTLGRVPKVSVEELAKMCVLPDM